MGTIHETQVLSGVLLEQACLVPGRTNPNHMLVKKIQLCGLVKNLDFPKHQRCLRPDLSSAALQTGRSRMLSVDEEDKRTQGAATYHVQAVEMHYGYAEF